MPVYNINGDYYAESETSKQMRAKISADLARTYYPLISVSLIIRTDGWSVTLLIHDHVTTYRVCMHSNLVAIIPPHYKS
jgi:hypothetical protein